MDERELGNLFMVGIHGTRFTRETREFIRDLNPCGVVLFSRNIEDPIRTANLNSEMQRDRARSGSAALFIGVDQEGGRVRRLRRPFSVFPAALEISRSEDAEQAVAEFASVTARELRLVGFNLDFVPVLDVVSETLTPAGSVIGDRSFGDDPETAAQFGMIVIREMRAAGVIPCCKHFPGHGGTSVDSHLALPLDGRSLGDLRVRDLIPFREAVRNRVEMVMTAHVLFSAIDSDFPATLSPILINGLLRGELSHDGVVITDDLDMAAVAARYSPEESAVRAFSAGVDILLFCNQPEKAFQARAALADALKDGILTEESVRSSLRRTTHLRERFAGSMQPCDEGTVKDYFPPV